jgi:hypothetical protein
MSNKRSIYLNRIQMLVQAVQAWITYVVVSRGVGKSTGIGPNWFFHRVKLMPRGASFIQGVTYARLLTNTLPPFITQLQKMGLIRGVDFVVRKKPPESWKAKPFVAPEVWDNTITWSNGHVTYLLSQDRPGSPNSLSLSFGMVDEAKFIDIEQFNAEVIPAIRGNREHFGHLPEFGSLLMMTDQPTHPDGKWILEKEKEMDPEQIKLIENIALQISKNQLKLQKATAPTTRDRLKRSISNLKDMWNEARKKSVLFLEGNVFDNIHALGLEYVEQQHLILPKPIFDVSILNKRMTKIKNGFYALLDDDRHCYTPQYNYKYLDSLKPEDGDSPDCRQDADLNHTQPLHIAFDHGASINCMSTGQGNKKRIDIRSFMYVLSPETTADLVRQWCQYYKPFQKHCKEVIYYSDHTSKALHGKADNITYVSEVISVLKANGWKVKHVYIGRTPSHTDRFKFWSKSLSGSTGFPSISFNLYRTEVLRLSMHTTPAKPGAKANEIKKDKSSERDKKLSQEKATHPTDSADTLVWGMASRSKSHSTRHALPAGM